MEEKTYQYTKFGRMGIGIFFLPNILYVVASLFILFSPKDLILKLSVGDYPTLQDVSTFLILTVLVSLTIWLIAQMVLFSLKYRITLTDTDLQIQAHDSWVRKLLNSLNSSYSIGLISYNEIMYVDADSWRAGVAKITLKDGRRILLAVRALENYPDFVEQLAAKLDVMQVGQGFLKLKQPVRFKILAPLILTVVLLPAVLLYFSMILEYWKPAVWNEELRPWYVTSVSKDTDDSIWVSAWDFGDNAYIWHISQGKNEHWTFSSELCADCMVSVVGHDSHNAPRIFAVGDDSASYTWNGKDWAKDDISFDLEPEYFPNHLTNTGTRVWGTHNEALAYVDLVTDEFKSFLPPDEVISHGLRLIKFQVNPDDSLLVWFSEKDMPILLYRFNGGNWQKITERPTTDQLVWDYCQDFNRRIWAITKDKNTHQVQVGLFDEATGAWTWADLKLAQPDRVPEYFRNIDIDFYGRIWVSGSYERLSEKDYSSDFIEVLDWTDNGVQLVAEYTEKNSNVEDAEFFIMTKERIWISARHLYWIDSENIPSPLPAWIAWLDYDSNFGWYFLFIIALIPLAIIGTLVERNS